MMSKTPSTFSVVVGSNPSSVERIYNQILEKMKAYQFSQDDVFAVHLAFEEAFLNAVEHGNKNDPTKTVRIEFMVDSEKVEIQVTDQGNGFYPSQVPDPRVGENLYHLRGRGMLLINAYMDVIEYNDQGNCLYMAKKRTH